MDALFGPAECPTVANVLAVVGTRMRTMVAGVFALAEARRISPRQAAPAVSARDIPPGRPYGRRQPPGPFGPPALATAQNRRGG